MSERLVFPDEPIRVDPPAPRPGDWEYPTSDEQLAEQDDDNRAECWRCGGDGVMVCDGGTDCPEADDAGCPFTDFHTYRCDECGGLGSFPIGVTSASIGSSTERSEGDANNKASNEPAPPDDSVGRADDAK